jgi:hypothetical protein
MPALPAFDYAIVRVVPRVEREEFVNVGVVLFCPDQEFLAAKIELDETRLLALFPAMERDDVDVVEQHLEAFRRVCEGGAGAGPIGVLPLRERWHWLVAPRSTIIQTSAPHSGLCEAPAGALERLLDHHVRPPRRRPSIGQ